ncbi:Hypothetical protein HVR_LOCUS539 [uncultured virus]|nr:Hypothetical protein HVR_LOCUS539 [uncultured virus]
MEIVDIYGHLADESEIIIGVGNYNNIHGLACYFPKKNAEISGQWPNEDLLQIKPVTEVIAPSVLQLILKYENPSNSTNNDKVYFSLAVKDVRSPVSLIKSSDENKPSDGTLTKSAGEQRYINVNIEVEGDHKVACATVSTQKAIFTLDYSSIDRTPRPVLMAGALYSLGTVFGEQSYIVSWKIQGFSNGDLVIFLPTTWYEPQNIPSDNSEVTSAENSFCQVNSGIFNLIERLNQLQFKGYSTQQWCEGIPQISNCVDNNMCGECFGQCPNPNHICYPKNTNIIPSEWATKTNPNERFMCGVPSNEPNMFQTSSVSLANTNPPQTTGTTATWIAIIAVFILVALLVWGLTRKYNLSYI